MSACSLRAVLSNTPDRLVRNDMLLGDQSLLALAVIERSPLRSQGRTGHRSLSPIRPVSRFGPIRRTPHQHVRPACELVDRFPSIGQINRLRTHRNREANGSDRDAFWAILQPSVGLES